MSRGQRAGQRGNPITEDQIERVAKALYELDRELDSQKGLRSYRWDTDAETKRNRYRLRAHHLLAVEDFARLIAQLDRQYRRAGQSACEAGSGFRPISASSARH